MIKCEKIIDLTKIATELSGFDQITGGGLPRSSAILLSGETGAGKKLLTRHLTWNLLHNNAKILYFSVDQSAEELRYDMLQYGWDVASFEANGQFKIVDIFTRSLDRQYENYQALSEGNPQTETYILSVSKLLDEIYDIRGITQESMTFFAELDQWSFGLLTFDSVTPLFSSNTKGILHVITELVEKTKEQGTTLLLLLHFDSHNNFLENILSQLTNASLTIRMTPGNSRFLSVTQYPGTYAPGPFPLEIQSDGTVIVPIAMPQFI